MKNRIAEIELKLNKKDEIIYSNNNNIPKGKVKQLQVFKVDGEIKKFGYSEQSIKDSLGAFKNGQKGGSPSVRTTGMSKAMNSELQQGRKVIVEIYDVPVGKTPKEYCDEKIEEYKNKHNGTAPEWNKQKNKKKWSKQ